MARRRDVLEAAPAVGNLLVLGQRVGDEREQPHVVLEHLRERFRRGGALLLVRVGEKVQRHFDRQRLGFSRDGKAQCRDGLVEQAVERAGRGLALLVEQPLQLLLELVGLLLAHVLDPRLVVCETLVLQRRLQHMIVDLVELQLEEDDVGGDGGELFGDVTIEFGALRVRLVAGIVEAGERAEPPGEIDEALERLDRIGQRRAVGRDRRELAVIGVLEALRLLGGRLKVAGDLRRRRRGVEIGEVPFRHRAERRRGLRRRTVLRIEVGSHLGGAKSHRGLRKLADRGLCGAP